MTNLKALDEKLKELPEEACVELLEYVEYLLYKYAEEQTSDPAYDKLLEEILTKRYQEYQKNPSSALSSEEVNERIRQKYGWNG